MTIKEVKEAILCDIDGVLVDAQPLYNKVDNMIPGPIGAEHHKAYDDIAEEAPVSEAGKTILRLLWFNGQRKVFFITSRGEAIREKTFKLLQEQGIFLEQDQLLMRTEPYEVPTDQVKTRQIKQIMAMGYKPVLLVDDSTVNCMAAIRLGVPAIRTQCISEESFALIP